MLNEQKQELIEICAQMVINITPAWCTLPFAKKMHWIKVQLNQCGYVVETSPDGCIELIQDNSYPEEAVPEIPPVSDDDTPIQEKEEMTFRDQIAFKMFDKNLSVKECYKIADNFIKKRNKYDKEKNNNDI